MNATGYVHSCRPVYYNADTQHGRALRHHIYIGTGSGCRHLVHKTRSRHDSIAHYGNLSLVLVDHHLEFLAELLHERLETRLSAFQSNTHLGF